MLRHGAVRVEQIENREARSMQSKTNATASSIPSWARRLVQFILPILLAWQAGSQCSAPSSAAHGTLKRLGTCTKTQSWELLLAGFWPDDLRPYPGKTKRTLRIWGHLPYATIILIRPHGPSGLPVFLSLPLSLSLSLSLSLFLSLSLSLSLSLPRSLGLPLRFWPLRLQGF